ncbi:MAG: hypothetical protein KGL39_00135 [Patescibacteria group bacterium]|nr:hypothetical protein [Patescibacteria group bacterium]
MTKKTKALRIWAVKRPNGTWWHMPGHDLPLLGINQLEVQRDAARWSKAEHMVEVVLNRNAPYDDWISEMLNEGWTFPEVKLEEI